ncbi:MAG TPA: ABC transporter ATP-binding protein [Fimbriimonadaceae bacterium]|nr:ABC transporter ATP-binding protein [Fimbriimonadaceae bacterium]HRJ95099.1 ABC transporter ATP-binding protein [Fimbriimonadaceae bacterium]
MTPHVRLRGIDKRFGSVVALEAVSLEVEKGTIHAIVGENGAGKTTLMKVLYGSHPPDDGTIEVGGEAVAFRDSADAIRHRIGMVSQHYSIIPELTCLQNLILGAEPAAFLDEQAIEARAQMLAAKMGFSFAWSEPAANLSPAGAQKLEILKLLWREADVMILDEPTAMLSPADAEALFESLTALADQGRTILLVTHRLPEVLRFCKRADVLRGGKNVATTEVAETSAGQLAEWIVGHAMSEPVVGSFEPGEAVLETRGLTVRGDRGDEAVRGVDVLIRSGEVVGLAGVDGNGQRELYDALVGVGEVLAGDVFMEGADIGRLNPGERIARGLRLIPEDRHTQGVIEDWSLEANAALGLHRLGDLRRGQWVHAPARRRLAERIAERFRTKHGGLHQPMRSLSGGNQQRFVAARSLEFAPRLMLAFQPTRGLDIDGTQAVYEAIRNRCREGAAALVASFDLDELLEHCDRIVVIRGGRIYEPPAPQARDRNAIGRLMVGAEAGLSA